MEISSKYLMLLNELFRPKEIAWLCQRITRRMGMTPAQINNGWCMAFANNLQKALGPEAQVVSTTGLDGVFSGHKVVLYQGFYYDAESPEGVRDPRNLAYSQRMYRIADGLEDHPAEVLADAEEEHNIRHQHPSRFFESVQGIDSLKLNKSYHHIYATDSNGDIVGELELSNDSRNGATYDPEVLDTYSAKEFRDEYGSLDPSTLRWYVRRAFVRMDYRRKGLGKKLYDYAVECGYSPLKRSTSQSDDGKAFWDKHAPRHIYWPDSSES
jgi:hypothetical protein